MVNCTIWGVAKRALCKNCEISKNQRGFFEISQFLHNGAGRNPKN